MQVKKGRVPRGHISQITKPHESQLKASLRYVRFMTSETQADWEELLGPDVVAISHGEATAEIAERFISNHEESVLVITENEQVLLQTAALVHDLGEIILDDEGVGDVTFEEHNAAHIKVEGSVFEKITAILAESPEKALIRAAYHGVAMDKETELGKMFNVIERIGYLETGLRAFVGVRGKRIKNWKGLTGNVLSNQIIPLLLYAQDYPYVAQLLSENAHLISDAFEATIKGEVPEDKDLKPSFDKEKLQKNFAAWNSSSFTVKGD